MEAMSAHLLGDNPFVHFICKSLGTRPCEDKLASEQPDKGTSQFTDMGLVPLFSGCEYALRNYTCLLVTEASAAT